ncbi:MAG: 50S ribosomal protein L6 [Phycisphaerae bacterium]
MSRIGKKPIAIPDGVNVGLNNLHVDVSGPLGKLAWSVPAGISTAHSEDKKYVTVARVGDSKGMRALHGLSRALIANMIEGVSKGYQRQLEVYGTGFSCDVKDGKLRLNIGFTGRGGKNKPQFEVPIPAGLEVVIEVPAARGDSEPAKFLVKGCDKQQVGHFSAEVRKLRPPEPYKGKGIRYAGEHVRRKQGKALAGASR